MMWIKTVFFPHMPSILTAITGDGVSVYFKATDVGRFLNYCQPHGFASRYAKTDFNVLMLENAFDKPNNMKKTLVFDFDEMIHVIRMLKAKQKMPHSIDEDMKILWYRGRTNLQIPIIKKFKRNEIPMLFIDVFNGQYNIQDWVLLYQMEVAKFNKREERRLKESPSSKSFDSSNYYFLPPPSVLPENVQQQEEEEEEMDEREEMDEESTLKQELSNQNNNNHHNDDDDNSPKDPRLASAAARAARAAAAATSSNNVFYESPLSPPQPQSHIPSTTTPPPSHIPMDLRMHFDGFPPDRIFIKIANHEYEYVKVI